MLSGAVKGSSIPRHRGASGRRLALSAGLRTIMARAALFKSFHLTALLLVLGHVPRESQRQH